jgi:hypothetical protein
MFCPYTFQQSLAACNYQSTQRQLFGTNVLVTPLFGTNVLITPLCGANVRITPLFGTIVHARREVALEGK